MFPFSHPGPCPGGRGGAGQGPGSRVCVMERSGLRVRTAGRVLLPFIVEFSFSRWWLSPGGEASGRLVLLISASPVVLGQFRACVNRPGNVSERAGSGA